MVRPSSEQGAENHCIVLPVGRAGDWVMAAHTRHARETGSPDDFPINLLILVCGAKRS